MIITIRTSITIRLIYNGDVVYLIGILISISYLIYIGIFWYLNSAKTDTWVVSSIVIYVWLVWAMSNLS